MSQIMDPALRGVARLPVAAKSLSRRVHHAFTGSGWWQVAETSAARIYMVLMMLLSTALTARFLGPEGRGVLVAAQGWAATFAALGYLSMAQPLFRRVNGKPPREWLPEALGTLIAIVCVVSLLGWGMVALGFWATGGEIFRRLSPQVLAAAFVGLPFMLWGENGNSILLAMGKLRVLNGVQVLAGTTSLAAVFVALWFFRLDVAGALVALTVNPLLLAVLGIAVMWRTAGSMTVRWSTAKQLLGEGSQLHLNAVGSVLSGHATILILNYYGTAAETAYLQLASQMLIGLSIIPGAVSSVAYTLIARHGADGAWPAHKRLLWQTLGVMCALSAVAYFLAPLAVRLIAGPEFLPAVPLFRLLLPTTIVSTIAVGTVSQWVARGLFRWLAIYGMVVGVVTVAFMSLLVPRYGMYGAAWVAIATSMLALLINLAVVAWIERRWKESLAHAS